MNIAIIGTGNVGGALATRLSGAKHKIFLGVRDPKKFTNSDLLKLEGVSAHSITDAVNAADVIIVAVPATTSVEVGLLMGPFVGDKVVIDATNTMQEAPKGFKNGFEALQNTTKSKNIVKCFNSTFASNLANPKFGNVDLDMFVAGTSKKGKEVATQLAKDVGFENIFDMGDDDKAELLEKIAIILVNLAYMQGYGPNIGVKIVSRPG
jgi:predicted dinucleotide-binding enzyme